MKHLRTFEDLNDLSIENDFNGLNTDKYDQNSSKEVVEMFIERYPEQEEFFTTFMEIFPTSEEYQDAVLSVCEEEYAGDLASNDQDEEVESLTDDEIIDEYWSGEGEVYMLEQELGVDFPGADIWCDFHNFLTDTDWWVEKKQPEEI